MPCAKVKSVSAPLSNKRPSESRMLRLMDAGSVVNQKLCEITDTPLRKLSKLNFQRITHPDDLAADERLAAKIASGELTLCVEKRYISKTARRWMSASPYPAFAPAGNLKYFISVVEDIRVRKLTRKFPIVSPPSLILR